VQHDFSPTASSYASSVFTDDSAGLSSMSSHLSKEEFMSAETELVLLLLNDEVLKPLYPTGSSNSWSTLNQLEEEMNRLLKRYSLDLEKEAHNSLQKSAAKFVRSHSRHVANRIRMTFEPEQTVKTEQRRQLAESTRNQQPNFILSPEQQRLLFAALNSNKAPAVNTTLQLPSIDSRTMAPMPFTEPPLQAPGSGTLGGFEDNPFIDYDYDFDADFSFDYNFGNESQGRMIEKLPGSSSDGDADNHDKRSHPDDEGNEEDGGGKRQEGDDRSSKIPGRKPLASEPTSVSFQ
jgi:hypothetical protein